MSERGFTVSSFYDSLSEGKLMGTECKKCGARIVPPRSVCPRCGSFNLEWFESRGEGILETFTIIHVPLTLLAGKAPYIVGIARLENGSTITGRILNVDPNAPEKIKLGARVKLTPLREGDRVILAFKQA